MLSSLRSFAVGFLMGSADVVPGVSGGTIALVTGVYERLVASIRSGSSALGSILKGDVAGFKRHLGEVEWGFLILILSGILTAVLLLASLISTQLDERPVLLAAGFFGLVLGSTVLAFRMITSPATRHYVLAIGVGAVMFYLLGFGSSESNVDAPGMAVFFGSGALAICAMILPGISGSLILVMVGMYDAVLAAVNERDFVAVGVFALGAIAGLAFFSQILHIALRRWHDDVLAVLIGLMIGSLRIVWPWPDGVAGPALSAPSSDLGAAVVALLVGFAVVLIISRYATPAAPASSPGVGAGPLPDVRSEQTK